MLLFCFCLDLFHLAHLPLDKSWVTFPFASFTLASKVSAPPFSLPLTSLLSQGLGHGHWSMSALSVGVFDGLSGPLTALWVSRDKGK